MATAPSEEWIAKNSKPKYDEMQPKLEAKRGEAMDYSSKVAQK